MSSTKPSPLMEFARLCLICMAGVFLLAILPLRTPRVVLNQHQAVESIRLVNLAQRKYAELHRRFACTLSELGQEVWPGSDGGLVDRVLASGTKSGYRFEIQCARLANRKDANKKDASKNDASEKSTGYTVTAVPVVSGRTGRYALCSEASLFQTSGEIWYSESGLAAECLAGRRVGGGGRAALLAPRQKRERGYAALKGPPCGADIPYDCAPGRHCPRKVCNMRRRLSDKNVRPVRLLRFAPSLRAGSTRATNPESAAFVLRPSRSRRGPSSHWARLRRLQVTL
jgi:type II secretory pathway pseudopilin PulG